MRNNVKNIETKLSLLGINIKLVVCLAGLAVVTGLIYAYGAAFTAVVAIYLGYKILRLVMRFFGLVLSCALTLITIFILIAIILLLIF